MTAGCPVCEALLPRQTRQERLSVTVPETLARYVKQTAADRGVSVSSIVSAALRHDRHARQEATR